jgi:DNA-binding transcriptional LysR family regulator
MDLIRQEKLDMALVDMTDRDRSLHFRKLTEQGLYVALAKKHPLSQHRELEPRQVLQEPQIVFNYDVGKIFRQWANSTIPDENVICTVDTAQAALDLVEVGMGVAFIPGSCIEEREGLSYVPLKNWHQALYMCILYDRWLEPPIWDFIEKLVKVLRDTGPHK